MIETEVGSLHRDEAKHPPDGPNRQTEAHSDLRDPQHGLQALAATAEREAATTFFQIVDQVWLRGTNRRQQSNRERREDGYADGEYADAPVDAKTEPVRQFVGP